MRHCCFLLLICLSWSITNAQSKRTNIGIFGTGVGLDFNYNPLRVFVIPDSEEQPFFDNFEGNATISDFNGNLLFYSDGNHVWNRNHQLMPDGVDLNGIFYDDNSSTTTQCIIVPLPKDPFRYYLITARRQGGALNYTLIDTRLNGGLGGIVEKGKPIFSPSTEKMCVVKHPSGEALWLIGHEMGTNNFRANLITENGIDFNPVISAAGLVHEMNPGGTNAIGYLKPSHDGKFLACAVAGDMGTFEYFNFDSSTGKVSGGTLLVDHNLNLPYGAEFSPDNTKLYVSHLLSGEFFQFDLTASDVAGSKIILGNGPFIGVQAALQLGPDGKIYANGRREYNIGAYALDIIHAPNERGLSCQWEKNAVYLQHQGVYEGLPEFVTDVVDPLILHDKFCTGDEIQFHLTNLSGYTSIQWDFGDPTSGLANSASAFTPSHLYNVPGIYRIKITATYENGLTVPYEQNVSVLSKPVLEIGRDTVLCPGQVITLKPQTDNSVVKFIWNDGTTEANKIVGSAGVYKVIAFNEACSAADSLKISFLESPKLILKDSSICFDEKLRIELPTGFDYAWSDGKKENVRDLDQAGAYQVEGKNRCETKTAKFKLEYVARLLVALPSDTILCTGETLALNASSEGAVYRWQDESIEPKRIVAEPGRYWVELSNRCETVRDTVEVGYDHSIDYFVPNMISPNEDDHNEKFIVDSRFGETEVSIFDRWGKKIFQQKPYANTWIGEGQSGLYYFSLRYRCGLKKGWLQVWE